MRARSRFRFGTGTIMRDGRDEIFQCIWLSVSSLVDYESFRGAHGQMTLSADRCDYESRKAWGTTTAYCFDRRNGPLPFMDIPLAF